MWIFTWQNWCYEFLIIPTSSRELTSKQTRRNNNDKYQAVLIISLLCHQFFNAWTLKYLLRVICVWRACGRTGNLCLISAYNRCILPVAHAVTSPAGDWVHGSIAWPAVTGPASRAAVPNEAHKTWIQRFILSLTVLYTDRYNSLLLTFIDSLYTAQWLPEFIVSLTLWLQRMFHQCVLKLPCICMNEVKKARWLADWQQMAVTGDKNGPQ